jgi:hypothetical protein
MLLLTTLPPVFYAESTFNVARQNVPNGMQFNRRELHGKKGADTKRKGEPRTRGGRGPVAKRQRSNGEAFPVLLVQRPAGATWCSDLLEQSAAATCWSNLLQQPAGAICCSNLQN